MRLPSDKLCPENILHSLTLKYLNLIWNRIAVKACIFLRGGNMFSLTWITAGIPVTST